MRRTILRAGAALLAGCSLAAAFAQSPAVNPKEADYAKEQQAQQVTQPLNNQPLWTEIRSGLPQFTSLPGRETNILIQPQGQTWRALRNGQLSVYGGWVLVLVVLAIAAFYWRRGTIPVHAAPTGRRFRRFTTGQRIIHWAMAASFVILALSGLAILFGKNVLLPLIGYTLFSWLAILSKNLHNFVGPVFVVCTVVMFVLYVRENFPQAGDLRWLTKLGGMFGGKEMPSWKFNAGEKLWFWGGVVVLGIAVGASGLVLDFPNFDQTRATMQLANVVHLIAATLFMAAGLGHIYLGTIGMAGTYDAMRTGYVDETWAREHHEYWYQEMKGRLPADEHDAHAPEIRHRPA
ncbi:MAG: formate dehydrogenase subunit gamma [Betaproteobacteria bacterium]